jgi:JmjC domain, hydroxylase
MYNADGSMHDDGHHGSTKLHLDVTDALNIMAWAADVPDGKPGYSIWDLFSAADTPNLRLFLREEGFLGPGDAIHSQCMYLGPKVLERLAAKYNVRPFRVIQSSGDAIFIPAGCPHQVCC